MSHQNDRHDGTPEGREVGKRDHRAQHGEQHRKYNYGAESRPWDRRFIHWQVDPDPAQLKRRPTISRKHALGLQLLTVCAFTDMQTISEDDSLFDTIKS